MKFTFVFLMSLVFVMSHQQHQLHQLQRGPMWWTSEPNDEYPRAFHYYPFETGMPVFRYTGLYSQGEQEISNVRSMMGLRNQMKYADEFDMSVGGIVPYMVHGQNSRPRIKSSMAIDMASNDDPERTFITDVGNVPWQRTITLRITSTCTSLRLITCIPIANLPAAPVPACRRRRHLELAQQKEDSGQYPILPTEVQTVTPTAEPWPIVLPGDSQDQTPSALVAVDMNSSKDEDQTNVVVSQSDKQLMRSGKLLGWQNFITSTTTTSWTAVSSTLTQTFVPGVNLLCLPPGFVVC
ncbi:hypothetical protein GHT06_016105 [Daphnia sinensis]|uniref:Uncharacterized protein n=1 Tax=Daphnia sinensis TaxID=1820382 RepID=A0AAD5LAV6_9CRUS|nr:hypothetical protein GHT06_016105 [Daphnia sinensis]